MPLVVNPVPTFTNGTVPTAATLNTLAIDTDTLTQLSIGRTTKSGTTGRPAAKVILLNTQSLVHATLTMVGFDAQTNDTDYIWIGGDRTHITVNTAGWYRIEGQVAYDTGLAGLRIARIFINGTASGNCTASSEVQMGATDNERVQVYSYEHLAAFATVQLGAYQDTGSALNMLPNTQWGTWLSVTWDSPY